MGTRPVVAGVDGSEESLRALEWAVRQAGRLGSPLRIA
jgi:nucleotide-binding universal stress UspA family protein